MEPLLAQYSQPPRNVWTTPSPGPQFVPFDWLHLLIGGIALFMLLTFSFRAANWYFGRHTTLGALTGMAGLFLLSGYASLLLANLIVDYSFDLNALDSAVAATGRDVSFLWRKIAPNGL